MLKSIRQVAIMVQDLQDAARLYERVLGMKPCDSQNLVEYSLTNAVLPAGGGTFVELLQPTGPQSPGARFLQRRGEGMYLLIFETDNFDTLLANLKARGVRITQEVEHGQHRSAFVHPSSVNGVFIEIVETPGGANPWPAAGDEWYKKQWNPLTRRIRQVAVLVRDLGAATKRWEELFGLKATNRLRLSFADLEMVIIPLKGRESFIELAQPTRADSSPGRYLERRGEGLYLLIFQVDDVAKVEAHLRGQNLQITTAAQTPGYISHGISSVWIHPRSMKGVFTQLSQVLRRDHPWPPAGEEWFKDA